MTLLAAASSHTLTTVRIMSRGRSMANSRPIPASGRFTAVRTKAIVTRPALGIPAAPTAASIAVIATITC
ncbi:MAG: hypothetical protein CNCCGFBP_02337 [Fimbriimonadaceae bacterium]|nr:hypothetical protein [Fimbriimonadaceae bacterium]